MLMIKDGIHKYTIWHLVFNNGLIIVFIRLNGNRNRSQITLPISFTDVMVITVGTSDTDDVNIINVAVSEVNLSTVMVASSDLNAQSYNAYGGLAIFGT